MAYLQIPKEFVPRKDVDKYYPRPSAVRVYEDKTLGKHFIDIALFLEVDWTKYRDMNSSTPIHWHQELREAHERAKDEAHAYYDEYGLVDGEAVRRKNGTIQLYLRKPRIGDVVGFLGSNNESDQVYIESEMRPTLKPLDECDYWQSKNHACGDARWFSMSDADYDVMLKKQVKLEEPIIQSKTWWEHGTTPCSSKKYMLAGSSKPTQYVELKGRWVRVGNEWEFESITDYDRKKQKQFLS
jgi:hypothetical protein